MDRKRLAVEQAKALPDLDEVKRELLQLPNVLAVGLGIKETAGAFTDQLSFRVYVSHKVDAAALGAAAIPKVIRGVKTDVLTPLVLVDEDFAVCGSDRETLTKHRPLQGGIAISTDSTSYGTLGWFATLDADDSPVLITNKHVLYDTTNETTKEHRKTAQPQLGRVSNCCCCECGSDNVIGESIVGIRDVSPLTATSVDVALAKIDATLAPDILFEITNDSSEEVLTVKGTAAAVVGQVVRKVGARSAFTRGSVIHIGDLAAAPADPGGGTFPVFTGQVVVMPADDETYEIKQGGVCKRAFSNAGDSGSVILNEDDRIVALLYRGDDATGSVKLTVGNNIQNVLDALAAAGLAITISVTPDDGERRRVRGAALPAMLNRDASWFESARDLNRASLLHWLVDRHQHEVLGLINHKRAVTVAWQRNQGPAFVAAIARSARIADYRIPFEIEGVTRSALLEPLERVLLEHGSDELKRDMARHREDALQIAARGETVEQLAELLKQRGLIDVIPDRVTRKGS